MYFLISPPLPPPQRHLCVPLLPDQLTQSKRIIKTGRSPSQHVPPIILKAKSESSSPSVSHNTARKLQAKMFGNRSL